MDLGIDSADVKSAVTSVYISSWTNLVPMKTQSKKPLRVGIVGAGILGTWHAQAFSQIRDTKVSAITDIVEDRAKKLAQSVGDAKAYKDWKDMLKNETLDIVSVTTPDHLHVAPVIDVAEAGVPNILCEKPLATTLKDAGEIAHVVTKAKTRFMVNFSNRWEPAFKAMRHLTESGFLGEPLFSKATLSNTVQVPMEMWGPPEKSWSKKTTCADFLLSHWTDLLHWITQTEPETVYAVSGRKKLKFTPDYFQAIMHFTKDFTVYFESAWILNRNQPFPVTSVLDLHGTDGTIYCNHLPSYDEEALGTAVFGDGTLEDLQKHATHLRDMGIKSEVFTRTFLLDFMDRPLERPETKLGIWIPKKGHDPELVGSPYRHFVECVLNNREPEPDLKEGIKQTEMVVAIKRAAETEEEVDIRGL
jgi:predicted dehydrogenase